MSFSDLLIAVNDPAHSDFRRWVFRAGMLFNSTQKWWGDLGLRDFPHEGVDFCLYENLSGESRQLDHHTRIPVIYDGVVRQIFTDYLGQALVVEHEAHHNATGKMFSIYAHTLPAKQVQVGTRVKQGEIIANIADTRQSKTPIRPHLHYTLGKASTDIYFEHFQWNDMRNPDIAALCNPLSEIDDPYC